MISDVFFLSIRRLLPLASVFDAARRCDALDVRPPQLDQLPDVKIVVRHPRGEHRPRGHRAELGGVAGVPVGPFHALEPVQRLVPFRKELLLHVAQRALVVSALCDPGLWADAMPLAPRIQYETQVLAEILALLVIQVADDLEDGPGLRRWPEACLWLADACQQRTDHVGAVHYLHEKGLELHDASVNRNAPGCLRSRGGRGRLFARLAF